MSYKITISKIDTQETEKDGDYVIIDKRPWTEAELESAASYGREDKFVKENPLKEIRGYAPRRKVIEKIDAKVLEQVVDNLDLGAVIKAINGL